MNINRLIPFLTIRKKLIIAFSLLSFIPLVVIGFIGISHNVRSLHNIALENLRHDVALVTERAQNVLADVNLDLQILTRSPQFKRYLESLQEGHDQNAVLQATEEVRNQFITFAGIKSIYYQLRYIDRFGDEMFRIRQRGSTFVMVPEEELSTGRFTFYFLLTDSLASGQVAFIPVELMTPWGELLPAISYASRIEDQQGSLAGIFIADVFAKELFRIIESGIGLNPGKTLAIVNNDGNYLYHSKKKSDWNRLLATRENESLWTDYSPTTGRSILGGESGVLEDDPDEIVAYAPLFLSSLPAGHAYYLFESVDKSVITAPAKQFTFIFAGLLLLFLALSIVMATVATNQLARPIRELQRGAEILAGGDYSHKLNIETNDEIEQLSHQFNRMAEALGERERLLEKHRRQLAEMVDQRTEELKGETEKLQAVLDNVPSAFLLLDEECRILSASEAIREIAGVIPDEIVGEKCFDVFSERSFCKNCPMEGSVAVDEVHSFVEKEIEREGKTTYIEHISIPLTLNHDRRAFLEILTDITERKKIEENLVKTEKLAATGEMAAVIAHEMRNSLTSVKMILQLQFEASQNKEDREALEVAVQSIYNMEKIVNSLLGFSRPAPLDFRYAQVNAIIEDSLLFIQPQLAPKEIHIIQDLSPNLPCTYLDTDHMKEAFINLLLNAAQAVSEDGKITISASDVKLQHELEDYAYSDGDISGGDGAQRKILLSENSRVIKITIEDDGEGIPVENLGRIFDPFFTTKEEGTGLGLTTVKRTVNQHGGIIRAESEPGNGTGFHIFLPIRGEA
jgi:PAS domain S-box-containing protein